MTDDRTPDMTDPAIGDPDVVAAEFVLGLLDGDERAAANRRLLSDPVFAAKVEQWRAHFDVLFDSSPAVSAPANGLSRLMGAMGQAANDNRPQLRFWQGLAAASTLAAAAMLLMITTQPKPDAPTVATIERPTRQALLVTQIAATDGSGPVAAVFDPANGALRIAPATLVDAGHSAELWVIAADGVPHSLGVLAPGKPIEVAIKGANRLRFVAGSVLAVTVEQPGGSPDGTPKGEVVAKGALSVI